MLTILSISAMMTAMSNSPQSPQFFDHSPDPTEQALELGMGDERTSEAAKRVVGDKDTSQERLSKKENKWVRRSLATAALAGLMVFVYESQGDSPEFSEELSTITVIEGEGLTTVAHQVEDHDNYEIGTTINYIENMPENEETLSDGLQAGEQVYYPHSVE